MDVIARWIEEQKCFWVATAPLSGKGHVNISPKGLTGTFKIIDNKTFFYQDLTGSGTFKIIDNKTFFYQDLTGSGVETAAHLRENGRITVLFNAFEGPPRICRLFGTGKFYELGSPRYNELIPPEERLSGSRAAVVVDVHKVGTSCGFSVPLYKLDGERTTLQDWTDELEATDRKFANEKAPWRLQRGSSQPTHFRILISDWTDELEATDRKFANETEGFESTNPLSYLDFMPSSSDPKQDTRSSRGMKAYWAQSNIRSVDGLPGLQFCRELAGLPLGPVKDDRKVFHVDIEEEKRLLQKFGNTVIRKVDETGFAGGLMLGLISGLALSLTWLQIAQRASGSGIWKALH
ncbi:unnamed protein product [Rhizoctonia solani]|uniref:Pyridoxamine 5'-phosphate oxidase putative domain-containing protein n=1 Tax=Rhizoctonia solani TaxID=456999 RepID=A0A8H3GIB6_9AGAM|nr:unnamed protein product [Rhizoctonia solani]